MNCPRCASAFTQLVAMLWGAATEIHACGECHYEWPVSVLPRSPRDEVTRDDATQQDTGQARSQP